MRHRIFGTSAFRLALAYLALFGLSTGLLLGFLYWTTAGFVARQTDDTIRAEITGLAEHYGQAGIAGLVGVVHARSRDQRQSLYLLVDPVSGVLAGNLDRWPRVATGTEGWLDFGYQRPVGGESRDHHARARHLRLPGGFQLLVGRDVEERHQLAVLLRESLIWAALLVAVLGLGGGLLLSRNILRRIDAVTDTSRDIMAGDLGRRVPLRGNGDEFDRLAESLNDMLDEIERLMGSLRHVTDNIAHDLRGPLNRLRNRLEVLTLEPPSERELRSALEQTIEDADGLLHTFNALLRIARAEAATRQRGTAAADLAQVLQDVADLYTPLAEEKHIALAVETEEAVVRGDRHLLSQMVANLMDNAVKYTPAGGRVTVGVADHAEGPVLYVTDTGPGIPAAERERVFERFVRLDPSRASSGAGLGLSLVRAVADAHKVALSLEDASPGLRVVARFPRASTAAAESSGAADSGASQTID